MAIYDRQKAEVALPQIEKRLSDMENEFFTRSFPVGSYFYTSDANFNPTVLGGEWELINNADPYRWHRIR